MIGTAITPRPVAWASSQPPTFRDTESGAVGRGSGDLVITLSYQVMGESASETVCFIHGMRPYLSPLAKPRTGSLGRAGGRSWAMTVRAAPQALERHDSFEPFFAALVSPRARRVEAWTEGEARG